MKNDNDLTARQLLRVIEIQIFRSDFETAAYRLMRSLFPQLSIECCFFFTLRWLTGANFLTSEPRRTSKYLEIFRISKRGAVKNRVEEQALHRGESLSKKSSKAVSREKRLQKITSEFQVKTNNGYTCMDYLEGLAHNVTY